MQSSPVLNTQRSISTSRHDSGSQPSLFGPWLEIFTPRTVTFAQSTGLISHIGEFDDRHVLDQHVAAAVRLNEVRAQVVALAETRRSTGAPRSAISNRRCRDAL